MRAEPRRGTPRKAAPLALAVAALACDGGGRGDGIDAGLDGGLAVPPGSCAQPGDVGNEIGVGAFCTPRGRECAAFSMAPLCLAQAAPDEGQWFCTRLCSTDDQCGSDARCLGDARGRACVPVRCVDPEIDAGTFGGDAGSFGGDAGGDGDAGTPEGDGGGWNDAGVSA
jgi:hypothetical protein